MGIFPCSLLVILLLYANGGILVVEIHTHVLPGGYDVPITIDESIQLIGMALYEGITEIIATPMLITCILTNQKRVLQKVTMMNDIIKEKVYQ